MPHATHEVLNQPPPLAGYDVAADPALLDGLDREGGGWAARDLHELGKLAGSAETATLARLANENVPVLRTHDRFGNRIDEVEFHPAWHQLLDTAVRHGLHAAPWLDTRPGAHVARAAKFYVWAQAEAGHGCPISMTYAAVPALRHAADLDARFTPLLAAPVYQPGLAPPDSKSGLLAGMAMTEKQGGSDVRANTTVARPTPSSGGTCYVLTGHKWFNSAPMCDLFLVLAQARPAAGSAGEGLTCFLLPRVLPDGARNGLRIQRLKDKLGNRSNASAEVEYDGALAWRVGEPGRGIRTIIDMVSATRLDCVTGSAAAMRQCARTAVHHAAHRHAFGKMLADQPLMGNVLADLVIEAEAAAVLAMRLAGAADRAARGDRGEAALLRIALPAAKYWVCKRATVHAGEALECLGGNGYVEDSGMPRLYREAPLNSIWEGSGNISALDLLRALASGPGPAEALQAELAAATGADARLDNAAAKLTAELTALVDKPLDAAPQARRLAELCALALEGALLVRYGPPTVADAFCASRLGGDWGHALGTLPARVDASAIVDRAYVLLDEQESLPDQG
ncbi:MAG TPA: acyl-CoA dehydrogenase family protein [Streptosporangiaceae bacterium]|nr:acyl-CoA dehydrogenase family protein [Streptosporangiaceae bacterium]